MSNFLSFLLVFLASFLGSFFAFSLCFYLVFVFYLLPQFKNFSKQNPLNIDKDFFEKMTSKLKDSRFSAFPENFKKDFPFK